MYCDNKVSPTPVCVILHPRKLCSGCNKWTAPTERWTAVAREGRRCPRACHTQAVCEDPVENGRAAGEQHQISCCQVCVDARSAVTCAACCSLHLSSPIVCVSRAISYEASPTGDARRGEDTEPTGQVTRT